MKKDKKTTLINKKYFAKSLKELDSAFEDLSIYLGTENESKLVSWIHFHKTDMIKWIKKECLESSPSLYQDQEHFPTPMAYVRYQMYRAIAGRGTGQFYCEAPSDGASWKISEWYSSRNDTHDYKTKKQKELDSFKNPIIQEIKEAATKYEGDKNKILDEIKRLQEERNVLIDNIRKQHLTIDGIFEVHDDYQISRDDDGEGNAA